MISATQLKRGMIVKVNGELLRIVDLLHITPGNWRGMVQSKLKNLKSGALANHRFRSEDRVERVILEESEMEYLYNDGQNYYFMNTETFDQLSLPADLLAEEVHYLTPNIRLKIGFYEGKPVGIALPLTVDLTITSTAPALKKATVSNVFKPATLETGLVVQVPSFIEIGERIRVDTSDGKYLERVK